MSRGGATGNFRLTSPPVADLFVALGSAKVIPITSAAFAALLLW